MTTTQSHPVHPQHTFGQLPIGQVFDFISGTPSDSFYARCVKLSARKYGIANDPIRPDAMRTTYTVGSIHAKVYHVGPGAALSAAKEGQS